MNTPNMCKDIVEFHKKFDLSYSGPPRALPSDMLAFRSVFMQEELNEFCLASEEGNLTKQFDALIDLVYVVLGTAYLMGLPFEAGWQEVHKANMAKVRVQSEDESKRRIKYDVVKPPGWVSPEPMLANLLKTNHTEI